MSGGSKAAATPFRVPIVALTLAMSALIVGESLRVARHVGETFPGFVVSPDLLVTELNQPYWPGPEAGLRPGDRVLSLDGERLLSSTDLLARVARSPAGTAFRYVVVRGGRKLELAVPSAAFPAADFVWTFGALSVTAIGFLLVGASIAWIRTDSLGAGLYSFSFAVALAMGLAPGLFWGPGVPLGRSWQPLLVAALVHFVLVFPEPARPVARRPWIAALPYLAFAPLEIVRRLSSARHVELAAPLDRAQRWLTFGAALALLIRVFRAHRATVAAEKPGGRSPNRVRVTVWGLTLGIASYAVGFVGAETGWIPSAPTPAYLLPAWIWFGTLAIACLRDDPFELGVSARERIAGAVAFAVPLACYLVLFGIALAALRRAGGASNGWIVGAFLFLLVALYEPLRRLAAASVERGMRSPPLLPPRVLRELASDLASSLDEASIDAALEDMGRRLGFARKRLFLAADEGWRERGGGPRLDVRHPLVRLLSTSTAALSREDVERLPAAAEPARCRDAVAALDLAILLPLRFHDRAVGFLGFGGSEGGRALGREDRSALEALASGLAAALENARVFQRIRELEEQLRRENVVLKEELVTAPGVGGLIGTSAAMRRLYGTIEQVAAADATVLLRGETGTGKELVARAIHVRSARRERPMIRVNCAAVPAPLLEAEFFGHERGAFTGATSRRIGRIELAEGGTIFLDEIGDLPAELQPKLLRVLQEKEFERVGGSAPIRADVRVIAATNRDVEALVARGAFRRDLFFRLNVLPIAVPPLRERRDDIPALVAHFLQRYAARMHKPISAIEERSLRALVDYSWPGNVRELENVIERATVLCAGDRLVIPDFERPPTAESRGGALRPLSETLREVKLRTIRGALEQTAGNQAHAAELLGIKPSSLSRMMRTLGLRAPRDAP